MTTTTVYIPKGYRLSLSTDGVSTGTYTDLGSTGGEVLSTKTLAFSDTTAVGPFNTGKYYRLSATRGTIAHSLSDKSAYTQDTIINSYSIGTKDDFPNAVNGVIYLESNAEYFITANIDLAGDRLVGGANTAIRGTSSETASITSTGLSAATALLTTSGTTPINSITFKDVGTAVSIDGGDTAALDWTAFNIVNVPTIGTIQNIANFILSNSAFLNSSGLVFTGNAGTIGINNSLMTGDGEATTLLTVDASAVVSRRVRLIYSSIVATGSNTAIDVSSSASIPTESFILDTVNFSGGATYLGGLDDTSNTSLFVRCVGINNTAVNGQLYMRDNATATTISVVDTWYKAAGTTTASSDNSKYTHTDNRLTCAATIERKYLINATVSFDGSTSNQYQFGFYDSKLGAIRTPSITTATTNVGTRVEHVALTCVVQHASGDYIEVHVRNRSSTNNVTVTDLNLVITEIK